MCIRDSSLSLSLPLSLSLSLSLPLSLPLSPSLSLSLAPAPSPSLSFSARTKETTLGWGSRHPLRGCGLPRLTPGLPLTFPTPSALHSWTQCFGQPSRSHTGFVWKIALTDRARSHTEWKRLVVNSKCNSASETEPQGKKKIKKIKKTKTRTDGHHGVWLNGVHRTCAETAAVSRGTSHAAATERALSVHHFRGY